MKTRLLTLIFFCYTLFSFAQTFIPDTSFGTNGFTNLGNSKDRDSQIKTLILPDKKIIVVGKRYMNETTETDIIARLNPNGTLDSTFATNGIYQGNFTPNNYDNNVYHVDGKIIIFYRPNKTLVKFNENGTLDTTFGTNGIAKPDSLRCYNSGGSVLINGYIYIVFQDEGSNIVLSKVDLNGNLIQSTIIVHKSNLNISLGDIYYGPNENILIDTRDYINYKVSLSLYSTSGVPETTFGNNGSIDIIKDSDKNTIENLHSYIATDDQKNIVYVMNDDNQDIATVKKYDQQGNLITTFGSGGSYPNTFIEAVKTKSNQIYVVGTRFVNNNTKLFVSRINPDGTLDSGFNGNGTFIGNGTDINYWGKSFNILSDGSIVFVGESFLMDEEIHKIYIAKYTENTSVIQADKESSHIINPVLNTLDISSSRPIQQIDVLSLDGKTIKVLKNNDRDMSEIKPGIYFLKVSFQNGNKTFKVIKE